MNDAVKQIIVSLNDLGDSILKSTTDDRTMTELWGWSFPPLSRNDLSNLAKNLANKLNEFEINEIDEDLEEQLEEIPHRISVFKKTTLQYLFNGHGQQSTPAYISLIEWITNTLEPLFGWQTMQDNKAMPAQLAKRLRSVQSELNEIVPEKNEIKKQIDLIKEATETAESLPADLETLKEARNKVGRFSSDAAELFGKIDSYFKQADKTSQLISEKKIEADKLVALCEDAYKITTTKGLAAAFDQRANKLSNSVWIWVLGLLIALVAGIYIGSERFDVLNLALRESESIGHIWTQIFLSMISFGAPIWFAWIATKQIGQRFKLAEDYAYKASVAKTYEGYRKEAARIDKDLEARLFSSALDRLEEAPLRLLEKEHYGSPWHELTSSRQFQKALDKVPELKDTFDNIVTKTIGGLKRKNGKEEGSGE